MGTEGDRIVFGAVGKGRVGRKRFSTEKADHPCHQGAPSSLPVASAQLAWPPAATGGRRPAALVVFTVVRKVLVFVVVVVGVLFCFVLFFLFGLACLLLKRAKKKVCNYFLQSSHYISVNNKEEIL